MFRPLALTLAVAIAWPQLALAGGEGATGDKLVVADRSVTFNGKSFRLPCPKDDLIAALGKPDRVESLANEILIWDNLGFFAYVRPGGKEAFGFNVALGDMRKYLKFAPKMPFRGVLSADGAAISAKSAIAQINRDKKANPFQPNFTRYSWRAEVADFVYFINHGTVDNWSEFGPICEFSVEWVGKKK